MQQLCHLERQKTPSTIARLVAERSWDLLFEEDLRCRLLATADEDEKRAIFAEFRRRQRARH